MALMACCESRPDHLHMRLSAEYRYFMAAGGCIWQAHDASMASRILRGIEEMSRTRWSLKLFAMVVVARMDSATLWSGDVRLHKTRRAKQYVPKVLYAAHAWQIAPFANLCVLNLGGHMKALEMACSWANFVCQHGKLPPMEQEMCANA